MYFKIRHLTRFQYSAPVTETLVELRMHPRTESTQRCLDYQLGVTPKAQIFNYRDFLGNTIHHFCVPGAHTSLQLMAESIVEMTPAPDLPSSLAPSAWDELDHAVRTGDFWEMLLPSHFARHSALLDRFINELGAVRRDDPLSLVRELNTRVYEAFEYLPGSTGVDSPIDHALSLRHGVCQDFAHVFIAMMRRLGIPARYVSGYLYHGAEDRDRSSGGATHAWLDVYLPDLGWTGLDPTNNLITRERHIRTAVGRDYADVPPTRGVYKGESDERMSVAVTVTRCDELPPELAELVLAEEQAREQESLRQFLETREREQQQQQQQQG